jgi:hypothetical protein
MITKRWQNNAAIWWRVGSGLIVIALLLIYVALRLWNISTTPQTNTNTPTSPWFGATQISEGGQVTIKATLQDASTAPSFTIVRDTHAVDLDGYDLTQLATLRTDQGQTVQPTRWNAPKGGHHREGTLTFPALAPGTRTVDLIIRNIAGVPERTLTWTR